MYSEQIEKDPGATIAQLRTEGHDAEANEVVSGVLRLTIKQSIERAEIESAEVQGDVV